MLTGTYALRALTPRKIELDRSRCSRHRLAKAGCRICFDRCPSQALNWGDKGLTWDESKCQNCLLCTALCPGGVFTGSEISWVPLLQDLSAVAQPVLACSLMPKQTGHALVPCLGALANSELLLAISLALGKDLRLNMTACAACQNSAIRIPLQQAIDHAQTLTPQLQQKLIAITETAELHFNERVCSRRELFSLLRNRSQRTGARLVERLQIDSNSSVYGNKSLPNVRRLLLQVLDQLPVQPHLAMQLFPQRLTSEGCRGCTGCVGVCPTGALLPPAESPLPPEFVASHCTGCHLCEAFCRQNAIKFVTAKTS